MIYYIKIGIEKYQTPYEGYRKEVLRLDNLFGIGLHASDAAHYHEAENENSFLKQLNEMKSASESLAKMAKESPMAASKQMLNSLLKQCELYNNALFTAKSWNALMKAYGKAKSVSLSDKTSLSAIKKMIAELNAAFAALEPAEKSKNDDETKKSLPVILKMGRGDGQSTSTAAPTAITTPVSTGSPGTVDVSV